MERMGFSAILAVRSGDEGVDDLPSAGEVAFAQRNQKLSMVLIEVRIFNEDQMVCNVEGASFYN